MIQRWITAFIGIPLLILCISIPFANGILLFLLMLVAGLILNYEVMTMSEKRGHIRYPSTLMSIIISLSCLSTYLFSIYMITFYQVLLFQAVMFLIFFYYVITQEIVQAHDFSENVENIGFNLLIYISFVGFFPLFLVLNQLVPNQIGFLLLFGFTWFSDAAGLFVGSLIGKTALPMLPSKSKTFEGYLGAFFFTALLGIIFYYLQGALALPFHWSFTKWILFAIVMNFSANIGDLIESLIKRLFDVKDSGTLLAGMGGLFDTIDSQIYSVAVAILFFI
ncbi:MAG: phosphatidate cytidylyltransferase [Brevinema sp.]